MGYRHIIFAIERDLAYQCQFQECREEEQELLDLLSHSVQHEHLKYSQQLVNEVKHVLPGNVF